MFVDHEIPTFAHKDIHSEKLRQAYYTEGALVIKGLLNTEDLYSVATFLQEILELKFPKLPDQAYSKNLIQTVSNLLIEAMAISSEAQGIIYDVMSQSAATHSLSTNPKILNIIGKLLSKYVSLHEKKILLMSPPHETWHLARWHQDYYYNGGSENSCTVYAPLQKTTIANGGLSLALGSHLNGLLPHDPNDQKNKWNTISNYEIEKFSKVCNIDMELGDVLFLHSLIPHTANINKSKNVRFVANFRYQDLSEQKFIESNWKLGDLSAARKALRRKND